MVRAPGRPLANVLVRALRPGRERRRRAVGAQTGRPDGPVRLPASHIVPDPALTVDDVLDSPYFAIGTPSDLVEHFAMVREVTGVSSFGVFTQGTDALAPAIEALSGR
jgi:hypothetical protein